MADVARIGLHIAQYGNGILYLPRTASRQPIVGVLAQLLGEGLLQEFILQLIIDVHTPFWLKISIARKHPPP